MENEKLLDLANDPRFIPGIFNYCDRWCERCTMTTRCLLFATLKETNSDSADLDMNNAEFWQDLQQIFQQTLELIKSWAEEHGIDLEAAVRDADVSEIASRKDRAGNHELVQAARRYAGSVERWFSEPVPRGGSVPVESAIQSDERDAGTAGQDLDEHTQDAVEIIRWYQHQIMVKLFRGLSGDDEEASVENDWQRDADGSVKVALIGMDRSIMAWGTMLRAFPDRATVIRPILLDLEQLRRRAEQVFPRAREFTRPGFDISPLVS